jgi:capsular polysaccharide biosynthesis protein
VDDFRRTTGSSGFAAESDPDLLSALRRQWLVVALAAILGAFAGWMYAATQPVVYSSQSTLLLIAAGDEQAPGGGRDRTLDVDTWATVARSTELLTEVADRLDLGLEDFRERSTAVSNPTGDVLLLTFEAGTEVDAVAGATVYSDLFLRERRESVNAVTVEKVNQLNTLADDIGDQIADLADDIEEEERKGDFASQSRLTVLIAAQQRATERLSEINAELATLDDDVETGRVLIDPSTAVKQAGLGRNVILISGFGVGVLLGLILALLKDRYDDRYASAVSPESLGVREIARVGYVDFHHRRRVNLDGYGRLATKLAFGRRPDATAGRVVLLLPVESRTVPRDSAVAVASALEMAGPTAAIAVNVWVDGRSGDRSNAYWEAASVSLDQLRSQSDLVLVPAIPLDQSSLGLGFGAIVERVILVISDDTPMRVIEQALEDLESIDIKGGDVIVLTSIRRRYMNASMTTIEAPLPTG